MNLYTEQKQTHRHGQQTSGCRGGGGGRSWRDWEFGVNKSKLLHVEWIDNEILLYSTGNYVQKLRWNMMKDNLRKRVCVYV